MSKHARFHVSYFRWFHVNQATAIVMNGNAKALATKDYYKDTHKLSFSLLFLLHLSHQFSRPLEFSIHQLLLQFLVFEHLVDVLGKDKCHIHIILQNIFKRCARIPVPSISRYCRYRKTVHYAVWYCKLVFVIIQLGVQTQCAETIVFIGIFWVSSAKCCSQWDWTIGGATIIKKI